jgi:cardiolipin synthase
MFIKDWKKDIFTVPNALSLFRLALIPVYVVMYLSAVTPTDYYLAAAVLAVSCLTDMIDGKIARHFNMVTTLGMALDPLADKAMQFTLIVCLAIRYPILWVLIGLFVMKEGFQLFASVFNLLKKGRMIMGALMAGKICTSVFFISLIFMILIPTLSIKVITLIATIDLLFLSYSFITYIFAYYGRNTKIQDLEA